MTPASQRFRLKVQQIQQVCLFELTWGDGQQLSATVATPARLQERYQTWQQAYRQFYSRLPLAVSVPPDQQDGLRGRLVGSGSVASQPTDWHGQLVQAEAQLMAEFHH